MKREPTRREQLRRAFHGPILQTIADQARVHLDGRRWQMRPKFWKKLYAELFAPYVIEVVDGKEEGRYSTEAMNEDEYALFLTKVQAHAANEYHVVFTEEDATC